MRQAHVVDGVVTKISTRPNWRIGDTPDTSRPLTAAEFIEHGRYPIQSPPQHDPATHKLVPISMDQWQVNENDVGPTHTVVPLTAEEIAAREKAMNPVPFSVSDRQFFQLLAIRGLISEEEALDAVGPGIIPAQMQALINQLPAEQQFTAKMLIRGATTFERDHQTSVLVGQIYGWDDAALDQAWRDAAAL